MNVLLNRSGAVYEGAQEYEERDMSLTQISTRDLNLYYGNKPAFKGVNLSIKPGSITAVVGPSGCGKSSFLLSLNRLAELIPGCTVSGSVRVGEHDIFDPETDLISLRLSIGMIFQKPNPFPLSVKENIALPLKEHGTVGKNEIDSKVEKVLKEVGLWDEVRDRLNSPALSLSGGQQQRLCIARTLALEPKVLLLDEPCSALDPLSSSVVEDLITELRGKYTIIIVTHNLPQARRIADYVAFFWMQDNAGALIEYGATKQIFNEPENELTEAYIKGARG